jgi:PKD repeat protein
VNVISMSWGEPLTGVFNAYSGPCPSACNATTDGTLAILDPVLEVAAAEGISVFAATGDCGAADGTSGLAVNYPAADPWATAVGGTVLIADSNGSYVTETGWSGNASGATAPGCVNQGGSGGGFASLPRPAWQASLPASPPGRATPDVSLDAGTPVSVVYAGGFSAVGGTSVATPIWAGITAIADQHVGAPLGFLDPSLYQIYGSANYARDFHDVLTGSNGYAAGAGWDAVTGIGSPIVGALVTTLAGAPRPLAPPAPFLFASPRIGRAPLTVSFAVNVTGGTGTYPVEEVLFGDGNSSASASGIVTHTYPSPGVYSAQAFVLDSSDNGSSSPPLAIVVGGSTLNASLSASTEDPAVGASVTFTFGTSGGVAPLSYNLSFGDGTFLNNLTGPTATHAYAAVGGYCAEVVARDSGRPPDGGASPRVAVAVGGAPIPDCGNDSVPLTLTPAPGPEVRDASVEFVNLFSVSGGTNGPSGLVGSLQIRAAEPYVEACQCAIFRTPGTYSVTGWYNDTVNQGAEATTTVTVVPALVGTFTASALSGPAPLTVAFTAASQGGYHADPASTAWTFGNGRAELGDAVQTTYTSPGEYLATGHLEDAGHGNASEAFLIDVLPSGPPAYGVAGSIAPAVDLPSGTTVQFSGSVVGPSGGPTAVLEWNLGNGAGAFGPTPSETYYGPLPGAEGNALAGGVSAILENTEVLANVSWSLPSFFALESGGALPRVQALALASGLAPTVGHTPFTTRATAVLSGPGTPTLVWSFGDGSTNSSATVLHPYVGGGLYTATVRAGDPYGDSAVDSYAVVAYSALAVTGGPSPASGAPPLTVTYTALGLGGNGPPYTYAWVFGNGSTASGPSVVRTYASAGVYTATVTVTDRGGASVHATWTVTVSVPPAFTPAILLAIAAAAGVGIGAVAAVRARPKPGAVAPDGA